MGEAGGQANVKETTDKWGYGRYYGGLIKTDNQWQGGVRVDYWYNSQKKYSASSSSWLIFKNLPK